MKDKKLKRENFLNNITVHRNASEIYLFAILMKIKKEISKNKPKICHRLHEMTTTDSVARASKPVLCPWGLEYVSILYITTAHSRESIIIVR